MGTDVLDRLAIAVRDSCSSNLQTASQVQALLSVKQQDLPVQQLVSPDSYIADMNISIPQLQQDVNACNQIAASAAGCLVLQDLLDAVTSSDTSQNNRSLNSFRRFLIGGAPVPANSSSTETDPEMPAISFMFVPLTNEECLSVSPVLSARQIIHTSIWASSTIFQNTNEYPLFFRTVPSDDHQIIAVGDLMDQLGVAYVGALTGEDDAYGEQGLNLIVADALDRQRACPAFQVRISADNPTSLENAAQTILDTPNATVILLWATVQQVEAFIPVYNRFNITGRVIIGSSDWFARLDFSKVPVGSAFYNAPKYGFVPAPERLFPLIAKAVQAYRGAIQDPAFVQELAHMSPFSRFYVEEEGNCTVAGATGCTSQTFRSPFNRTCPHDFVPPHQQLSVAPSLIQATYVLLEVIFNSSSNFIQPVCISGRCELFIQVENAPALLARYRDFRLPCKSISGQNRTCPIFTADQSGYPFFELQMLQPSPSRREGLRRVGVADWDLARGLLGTSRLVWEAGCLDFGRGGCVNMQRRQQEQLLFPGTTGSTPLPDEQYLPRSVCSEPCPPGTRQEFDIAGSFLFCCWTCSPCQTGQVSTSQNSMQCQPCPENMVPNSNRSACMARIIVRRPWDGLYTWLVLSLGIAGVAESCCFLAMFIKHRANPIIVKANRPHMTVILVSAILGHAVAIFFLFDARDTNASCALQRVVLDTMSFLSLCAILFKTERLNTIFHSTNLLKKGRMSKLLRDRYQVVGIFLVAALVAAINLGVRLGVGFDARLKEIDERRAGYFCDSAGGSDIVYFVILMALIVITGVLAFQARNLPDEYNDSKLIIIAAATSGMVYITSLPLLLNFDALSATVVYYLFSVVYHLSVVTALCTPRAYWLVCGVSQTYSPPANTHGSAGISQTDSPPASNHSNDGGSRPHQLTTASVRSMQTGNAPEAEWTCQCKCHYVGVRPRTQSNSPAPRDTPNGKITEEQEEQSSSVNGASHLSLDSVASAADTPS